MMKRLMKKTLTILGLGLGVGLVGGIFALNGIAKDDAQAPYKQNANYKVATFAGGCFWCIESSFEQLPGVVEVVSGYSGGEIENPTYEQVSSGKTKHIEVAQIYYDPSKVSYSQLVEKLWRLINPTDKGGSFYDRGPQYRSAIFYHNEDQRRIAMGSLAELEASGRFQKPIVTELRAFKNFYDAEEYHQDYYKKNPVRYKYYRYRSGRDQYAEGIWGDAVNTLPEAKTYDTMPSKAHMKMSSAQNTKKVTKKMTYSKPSKDEIKAKLTALQFDVTQKDGTERPFDNAYWDNKEEGIYVDIVSGEPLFSSKDKYDSKTGWPSFTKPLHSEHVTEHEDNKFFMKRVEVRSKYGDSHLGHVFDDGPAPTGLRYCINSASLRFVPKDQLQKMGYAEYLSQFK